jgi:hypothetical protein
MKTETGEELTKILSKQIPDFIGKEVYYLLYMKPTKGILLGGNEFMCKFAGGNVPAKDVYILK